MTLLIDFILIALLTVTAWQDFRERGIWWWLIPLLAAGFVFRGIDALGWSDFASVSGINLGLMIVQLAILAGYVALKRGKVTNLLRHDLGLGDVLFFAVVALAFSTPAFLIYYVGSLMVVLIGFLIAKAINPTVREQIPLAGGMAVVLIGCLMVGLLVPDFDLYDDAFLLLLVE